MNTNWIGINKTDWKKCSVKTSVYLKAEGTWWKGAFSNWEQHTDISLPHPRMQLDTEQQLKEHKRQCHKTLLICFAGQVLHLNNPAASTAAQLCASCDFTPHTRQLMKQLTPVLETSCSPAAKLRHKSGLPTCISVNKSHFCLNNDF